MYGTDITQTQLYNDYNVMHHVDGLYFFFVQVLGGYPGGLHTFTDQRPCIYYDMHGVDIVYHCVAGSAIRVEGSRVHATNRATEMHGFAGYRISSTAACGKAKLNSNKNFGQFLI